MAPPRVNERVREQGGRLDLIPSHLGLIDIDLDLAAHVGGSQFQVSSSGFLWVHRLLADALAELVRDYDVIMIDCAPNFNMVTRTAIVASEHMLIPAKADYLSTLGIDYLRRKLAELVRDYNGPPATTPSIPAVLGVVFTMIQIAAEGPIIAVRNYVTHTEQYDVPVFRHDDPGEQDALRDAPENVAFRRCCFRMPIPNVQNELRELATEFLTRVMIEGAT